MWYTGVWYGGQVVSSQYGIEGMCGMERVWYRGRVVWYRGGGLEGVLYEGVWYIGVSYRGEGLYIVNTKKNYPW